MRFNQPVHTPDGKGTFISAMNDGTEAQVGLRIPADQFGDDDLARFCPRYETMNAQEKKAYRKKAKIPVNRVYPLATLEALNE